MKEGGQILVLEPVADSLVARLFAVIDDESWKYKLAEKTIDRSGVKVFHSGSVRTWWVFENFTEMTFCMCDYFGLELNRGKKTAWLSFWAIADHRGGPTRSNDEVFVTEMERRGWFIRL